MPVPKKPSKEYLASILADKQAKQLSEELSAALNKSLESNPELGKLFYPKQKRKQRFADNPKSAKPMAQELQPTLFDMSPEYQ